ncbi:MAG: hypothetical protein ACRCYS_15135, partial [Beijerinckiaceae bacterium]
KLTKPQTKMVLMAMRGASAPISASGYRVAGRLVALGYGEVCDHLFYVNRAGLEALLYDRKMADWRHGSMATMKGVQEVEAALVEAV